jgi:hypothetical protein
MQGLKGGQAARPAARCVPRPHNRRSHRHQPAPTAAAPADLPPEQANYVLSRLKLSRLDRIHNINGFIATIIKRTQREGCDDGEGDLGMLPRAVEARLEALLSDVRALLLLRALALGWLLRGWLLRGWLAGWLPGLGLLAQ